MLPTTITRETDLSAIGTEELKQQLAADMEITAATMIRLAVVIRELEDRGEDLSELRIGLLPYLRLIASGQLSAAAVVRFSARPVALNAIGQLPIRDQDRLAAGERVALAVMHNGAISDRLVDPLDMTPSQLRQVFGGHAINTVSQQVPRLVQSTTSKKRESRASLSSVRADRDRVGLVVGRKFVPLDDVLLALAELKSESFSECNSALEPTVLNVPMTIAEHTALKVKAAQTRSTIALLVRRAMAAAGLI
jgi:hypothetical protein